MTREDKIQKLEEIAKEVRTCQACSLWREATNGVPGEGDSEAEIMFIGEGPGFNENQQGRPFVGQAGKLLDQLLSTIGARRQKVFITNIVKHRPPNNRDPLPIEIEACRQYLDEQIRIIEPKIIVTLGRFSLNRFLPGEYISRAHGLARYWDFAGRKIIVLPLYHPAAALRSDSVRAQLQEDFKKIKILREERNSSIDKTEKSAKSANEQLSFIN
jgi:DNA polymerase